MIESTGRNLEKNAKGEFFEILYYLCYGTERRGSSPVRINDSPFRCYSRHTLPSAFFNTRSPKIRHVTIVRGRMLRQSFCTGFREAFEYY